MARSLIARLNDKFNPDAGLSRREVLKAALAAAGSTMLSSCVGWSVGGHDYSGRHDGPRVVVIGAGFAGLACAYELHAAGYDVIVVEARKRVGGRVMTIPRFAGTKYAEGGGELIGSNHPTWMEYARRFSLEMNDVSEAEGECPVVFEGKKLNAAEQEALWEGFDAALPAINAAAEAVDADQPWLSAGAAELDARHTGEALDAIEMDASIRREFRRMFAGDNGVAVERQSWLGNLAMVKGGGGAPYWTDSEVYRCRGGNQSLAYRLAAELGDGRVRLGLPVAVVRANDKGAAVTLASGERIECDRVVVAVPPPTWKKIDFDPAIPADWAPQMGVNVKYLASLQGRFWQADGQCPDALTDGAISETWEATDAQRGETGAALAAYSGGPAAEACRAWADKQAGYAKELGALFPGFGASFVKGAFMDWPGQEWTGCGYSFPAPGEVTAMGAKLREGMGRVQFAGEHCCYQFVGYMEGGLYSGAQVARRVAVADGVAVGAK